jgi:hypothetical protein
MSEFSEAQDPSTPAPRLRELAQRDLEHALAVAQNPAAPSDVLQQFVEVFNQDPELIKRVISNPNTPAEALIRYGWSQPEALLQNPIFPILLLEDPWMIENIPTPTLERILALPEVPIQFLERHVGHSNPHIQARIAAHPLTPVASLQTLLEKEFTSWLVMSSLAKNKNLTVEMIEQLATHKHDYVLLEISKHTNTPTHILVKLSGLSSGQLQQNLAAHPNTPDDIIEQLAHREDPAILEALAGRHKLPRAALRRLAGHPLESVHLPILLNQGAGELRDLYYRAGYSQLADYTRDETLRGLPSPDLSFTQEDLATLSVGLGLARRLVALHPNTTEARLARLAIDPDEAVRAAVVQNQNSTAKVLLLLKKEPSATLRERLVRHPNTPLELFMCLAADRELHVRLALASYQKTPQVILRYLFEKKSDPKGHIKKAVAKNAGLDLTWLLALAKYRDVGIRLAVAKSPAATPEILTLLSTDPTESIRSAVAQHPNTSHECLSVLSQDDASKVSAEAKRHKKINTSE